MKAKVQASLIVAIGILSCMKGDAQGVLPNEFPGATEISISPSPSFPYSYGSIYSVSGPRYIPDTVVSSGPITVPEPASRTLFVLGVFLLALGRRSQRTKCSALKS